MGDMNDHSEAPRPKLRKRSSDEFAGVRKVIFARCKETGVTYADLSRPLGRNNAYMHQYMHKGTPKRIDKDARVILADMLAITPDELREGGVRMRIPAATPSAQTNLAATKIVARVPLFRETEAINMTKASKRVPPIGPLISFAVWIEKPRKKLSPGDIVFAKPNHPVRPTDHVVIHAGNKVAGLGEVHAVGTNSIAVDSDSQIVEFTRDDVQILKIVGAIYP